MERPPKRVDRVRFPAVEPPRRGPSKGRLHPPWEESPAVEDTTDALRGQI